MAYGQLASREYKVMLDQTRFGPPDGLETTTTAFWSDLGQKADAGRAAHLDGRLNWKEPKIRTVSFWDTPEFEVYERDYILRRRFEPSDEKVKITLKKRHPDRVLAAYNGIRKSQAAMPGLGRAKLDRKFEEDIKPAASGAQRSLFSHSLNWKADDLDLRLDSVSSVDVLFPGFAEATGLDDSSSLHPVRDVEVNEWVHELSGLQLHGAPDVDIEAAMIFWYETDMSQPVAAEFSFRYGAGDIDFSPAAAEASARLLRTLGVKMTDWCAAEPLTKTSWMYRSV